MVAPDPPWSSRSLGDMLGTSRPPDELVGSLSDQFRVTREEWGALLSKLRSGRGLRLLQLLCLWGGPVPGAGVTCPSRVRPGQNDTNLALVIILPGRPLF